MRTVTADEGLDVPAVPPAVTEQNDNPTANGIPDISKTYDFRVDPVVLSIKSGAVVPTVGLALS